MKRILVPTDFSATADKALNYATQIAKKANAQIVLLHVVELLYPDHAEEPEAILDYNQSEIAHLNSILIKYQAALEIDENVKTNAILYNGKVVESITAVVEKHNIDLVVMATHGRHNLRSSIFGTRTAAVISATKVPVIAVPREYELREPKNILLAVNETNERDDIFTPVIDLAKYFDADVSTVTFADDEYGPADLMEDEYVMQEVKYKLKKTIGKRVEARHISGPDFAKSIQHYVEENNVDLLVMVTHKRTFLEKLFASSMTKKMAYHTTVPLLSLHA